MYSYLDMFRVHTPIIRSIRCWVTAYGFLHRVCGADGAVRVARLHPHRTHDLRRGSQDHHPFKNLDAENHMLQLNI